MALSPVCGEKHRGVSTAAYKVSPPAASLRGRGIDIAFLLGRPAHRNRLACLWHAYRAGEACVYAPMRVGTQGY